MPTACSYAFDQQLVNLGHTLVRSFDLDVRYRLETTRLGHFDFNLGVDWLARLRRQIQPDAAEEQLCRLRRPAACHRTGRPRPGRSRDWVAGANLRYTGHYAYAASADSPLTCPDEQRQADHCDTPAFTVLDLDLDYGGLPNWRIGLNVHNALDHRPTYYGGHRRPTARRSMTWSDAISCSASATSAERPHLADAAGATSVRNEWLQMHLLTARRSRPVSSDPMSIDNAPASLPHAPPPRRGGLRWRALRRHPVRDHHDYHHDHYHSVGVGVRARLDSSSRNGPALDEAGRRTHRHRQRARGLIRRLT